MKRILKKYMSLKYRIPSIIILSLLILGSSIIGISYKRYEEINVEKHVKMAQGITMLMAENFDVQKIDYYMENNYSSDEYKDLIEHYKLIMDSYLDVKHIYIYKFYKDKEDGPLNGRVIVDMIETGENSTLYGSIATVGNTYLAGEETAAVYDRMISGQECVFEKNRIGEREVTFLAYIKPIMDSEGNYMCSMGVDFSLNELYGKGIQFIIELLVVITVVILAVIIGVNILLSVILFRPLEKMTSCIQSFKFDTDKDRFDNLNGFESLNIHLNNEIDELYNALLLSLKDSAYYVSNFNRAKNEIEEISETAYKDALTSVGSKTAYNGVIAELQEDVDKKRLFCFGFVMIDVNNLKYVNDTYGHELGDEYIKGCCSIVCNAFKRSPVFRIGGDEFVVILKDADYDTRMELADDMEEAFTAAYSNKEVEPYYRYSASYGLAIFDPLLDKSVEEVLKRADQRMYEYKKEFKRVNGSYR
jgi:diguanylate cyclase (GGDEF)-like protein